MPTTKTEPPPAKAPAKSAAHALDAASVGALIDAKIAQLSDWRGALLSRLRALINQADPGVTEEWKWDTPVWSHTGIICTGEVYAKVVKLTFPKGASLPDPSGLFNSSLAGNVRRAIDLREGAQIDAAALAQLVRAAIAANQAAVRSKAR